MIAQECDRLAERLRGGSEVLERHSTVDPGAPVPISSTPIRSRAPSSSKTASAASAHSASGRELAWPSGTRRDRGALTAASSSSSGLPPRRAQLRPMRLVSDPLSTGASVLLAERHRQACTASAGTASSRFPHTAPCLAVEATTFGGTSGPSLRPSGAKLPDRRNPGPPQGPSRAGPAGRNNPRTRRRPGPSHADTSRMPPQTWSPSGSTAPPTPARPRRPAPDRAAYACLHAAARNRLVADQGDPKPPGLRPVTDKAAARQDGTT